MFSTYMFAYNFSNQLIMATTLKLNLKAYTIVESSKPNLKKSSLSIQILLNRINYYCIIVVCEVFTYTNFQVNLSYP